MSPSMDVVIHLSPPVHTEQVMSRSPPMLLIHPYGPSNDLLYSFRQWIKLVILQPNGLSYSIYSFIVLVIPMFPPPPPSELSLCLIQMISLLPCLPK